MVPWPTKPQHTTTSVFSSSRPTPAPYACHPLSTPRPFHSCPHQSLHSLLLPLPLPAPPFFLLLSCPLSLHFSPLTFPSLSLLSLLAMTSSSCSWGRTWRWTFHSHWAHTSSWPSARSPDRRPRTTQRRGPATAKPVAQVHGPAFPKMEGIFCSSNPLATGSACTPRWSSVPGNFPMGKRGSRRPGDQDSCPFRKPCLMDLSLREIKRA